MISQAEYIDKLIDNFGLHDAKPLSIPMKSHWDLSPCPADLMAAELSLLATFPYHQLIGSMMYAMTATHPDIAYAIGKLSCYLSTYTAYHFNAAKDVLHYLKGTRDLCIIYDGTKGIQLHGLVDSAFIDKDEERKSISGFLFTIAGGAVA